MYTIIDETTENQSFDINKITPEMLGLEPMNDFAEFAQQQAIDVNPEKAKEYAQKGGIGILEAGSMFADEFDGNYYNVETREQTAQKFREAHPIIGENRSNTVDERIAKNRQKQEDRKKRINEGTANFFDKIANTLDKVGEVSYKAQVESAQLNEDMQKPNKDNANFRYEASLQPHTGKVVYNEIDLRKKIDFFEGLKNGIESGEALPFLSGKISGDTDKKIRDIADRINNGESIRQDELNFFNHYIDRKQEKLLRGYTIGGQIGEAVLPSILAFGSEIALGMGVMGKLGLSGLGKAGGVSLGANLLKGKKVSKGVAKAIALTTGTLAEAGISAGVTTAVNPQRMYATFQERRLNDEMKITDRGTVIFTEAKESPAKAFFKSLGAVYTSYFAEGTGALIGAPIRSAKGVVSAGTQQFLNVLKANPQLEKLIKKSAPIFAKAYEKINNLPIKGKSAEWLKGQVKFDGFIEELGEEVLEDVLNLAIGTNYEERSLENYIKKIVKTPEEWAVLSGVIALQGGALSIAGNLLGDTMQKNGASEEDIIKVLMTSTEDEKAELNSGLIENGSIKIEELSGEDTESISEEIAEIYRASGRKLDEDKIAKMSNLHANILSQIAEKENRDIAEVVEEYLPSVEQVEGVMYSDGVGGGYTKEQIEAKLQEFSRKFDSLPADYSDIDNINRMIKDMEILEGMAKGELKDEDGERAYQILKGIEPQSIAQNQVEGGILFQSAYHGTPHKFDEFSTEHIGSGEGAQAHGWGLYFAENKDVSENYRKNLIDNYSSFERIKYKGQSIDNETLKTALFRLKRYGIEDALSYIDNKIDYYNKRYNEAKEKYPEAKEYIQGEKSLLDKAIDVKSSLKEININDIDIEEGQLFEVDIPEDDVLLDENKSIEEQPEDVKNALVELWENEINETRLFDFTAIPVDIIYNGEEIGEGKFVEFAIALEMAKKYGKDFAISKLKEEKIKDIDNVIPFDEYIEFVKKVDLNNLTVGNRTGKEVFKFKTGKELYHYISGKLGSEREASLKLNEYGIKGITYDGRQDGRCYVIFDDKAVDVLRTFYQEEGEQQSVFEGNNTARKIRKVKGGYLPVEKFIELFENADESTIIHETAHWWLDTLVESAKYSEESAEDLQAVRNYLRNDGSAFTREQHEKFARGFEAYIRNGTARTNKLKKVFEDFKNFLLSIYDNLLQLGHKEEDMPEVQKLFDRLLTTERERVQKTVFDKLNSIDEQIQKIQENQEKELEELDELWRENQSALNRKSDKKRKVDEYLELAEKAVAREPKELKEYKKRYKEATLSILSVATGMKKNVIADRRNWEKVQMALEHADDKITASGGMRPEWSEFYADTGVSYDNDEIGGDYELAQQAFDVLTDGTYSFDNTADSVINEFVGKFDYLYGKVLSLKGEEKATALEAVYSLFNDEYMPSLPDELLVDLVNKLAEVGETFEEQQKEDFNKKRYPNIPVVQQLQFYITDKLRQLKIYNPETRYRMRLDKSHRLYRYIKNATSVNSAKEIIRKINSFVVEDMRNQQRQILHREIQKQIKVNSKLVKVGASVQGKFDWKTNTVFAELKEMNKLSRAEAEAKLEELIKLQEIGQSQSRDGWDEKNVEFNDYKNDFDENIKKNFLEYKAMTGRATNGGKGGSISNLNTEIARTLLEKILELKSKGREAKSKAELDKKLNKRSYRNNYCELIAKNKGNKISQWAVKHLLHSGETLANWESTINAILGSHVAEDLSLLKDEANVETYQRKIVTDFYSKVAKIYGFKKASGFDKFLDWDDAQKIIDLFQDFEKEEITAIEKSFSINTGDWIDGNVTLTKGKLITLYAWSLNENLQQRLYTQYGSIQLEGLFNEYLSDKERDLAWLMIDTLQRMYPDINRVYIETTGLSLPQEENYFPSNPERVISDLDLMHDFIQASRTPSATKARKICNRIKMKPVSPMQIMLPHIEKMSRYVVLQEKLNFYRTVFADHNLTTALRNAYGEKDGEALHKLIKDQLDAVSFGGNNKLNGKLKEYADNISKNYIVGSIAGSLKVALGQLTSMINYSENMPFLNWQAGFLKAISNPVENFKYMLENCPYLQSRLAGNTQNEIIASLTDETDKYRKLTNFFTSNVKWGDIIAITMGGRPYVDYLMSQGMSKEEAFEKFAVETLRAQQAGTASSTSQWQKHQSRNALGRMFWAFRNTEFQYERKVYDAFLKASRGDIDRAQAIKTIFIYRVLNPILFTCFLQQLAIAPLLRILFGSDDDPEETLKSLGVSSTLALMMANLSHWGYAGIIGGFIVQCCIKVATKNKKQKIFKTQVPFISDVEDIAMRFTKKGGAELKDWIDGVACILKYKFGIPAEKIINAGYGVADIVQGNPAVGVARVAGWGEYTATEAITGKVPKKKKKRK